jgi:hypothetical protein
LHHWSRGILEALTVHTNIDNEGMYPEVPKPVPELEDDILEPSDEHHVANALFMESATMPQTQSDPTPPQRPLDPQRQPPTADLAGHRRRTRDGQHTVLARDRR